MVGCKNDRLYGKQNLAMTVGRPEAIAIRRIASLQDKMLEYVDAGVRLGWLIELQSRTVTVYRQGGSVETVSNPESVSRDVLVGLTLDIQALFGDRK
jgi:Uma2 family endonuclease